MIRNYGLNCFRSIDEEHFIYASTHGMRSIEIHLDKSHISIESFTEEKIEEVRQLCEKHNVSLSIHNPYDLNVSDIIPFFRKMDSKYLLETLNLAKKINATHITAHIGNFFWFPVENWMRKKALERFVKSMSNIVEQCEKCNVTFALENLVQIPTGSDYYYLGDNLEDFHFLFENLKSEKFMMCLDIGHANVGDGAVSYINNFGNKIKTIHYHDNNGDNDSHLPVGEGNINWKEITSALSNLNYNGPLISECRNITPHEAAALLDSYFSC